jgi:hypothetical protein
MQESVRVLSTGQQVWFEGHASGSAAQLAPASGPGVGWTVDEQRRVAAARRTTSDLRAFESGNGHSKRSQKWDRDLFQRKVPRRAKGITSGRSAW